MAPGARLRPPRNRRFSTFNHQARRLLSTLYATPQGAFAQLVELLARAEDLAHILAWSAEDGAGAGGAGAGAGGAGGGAKPVAMSVTTTSSSSS